MDKIKKISIVALMCLISMIAFSSIVTATNQYDYNYDDWAPFAAMGGLFCLFGIIIWFVVFILIAIWVYRDAEKRGSSGALWLIVVIILGLIGIIIWLIVRPPIGGKKNESSKSDRRCPNCGKVIPEDARTCPYCSKKFEE